VLLAILGCIRHENLDECIQEMTSTKNIHKCTITTLYYSCRIRGVSGTSSSLAGTCFVRAEATALVAVAGASAVAVGGVLFIRAVVAVALVLTAGAAAALRAAGFAVLALGAVAFVSHWCKYVFVGRGIRCC